MLFPFGQLEFEMHPMQRVAEQRRLALEGLVYEFHNKIGMTRSTTRRFPHGLGGYARGGGVALPIFMAGGWVAQRSRRIYALKSYGTAYYAALCPAGLHRWALLARSTLLTTSSGLRLDLLHMPRIVAELIARFSRRSEACNMPQLRGRLGRR